MHPAFLHLAHGGFDGISGLLFLRLQAQNKLVLRNGMSDVLLSRHGVRLGNTELFRLIFLRFEARSKLVLRGGKDEVFRSWHG